MARTASFSEAFLLICGRGFASSEKRQVGKGVLIGGIRRGRAGVSLKVAKGWVNVAAQGHENASDPVMEKAPESIGASV